MMTLGKTRCPSNLLKNIKLRQSRANMMIQWRLSVLKVVRCKNNYKKYIRKKACEDEIGKADEGRDNIREKVLEHNKITMSRARHNHRKFRK